MPVCAKFFINDKAMSLPKRFITFLFVTSLALAASGDEPQQQNPTVTTNKTDGRPLTQIAILLDTSGSMRGLIDQARCQLWNAVSELAKASRNGAPIKLEIAIYQYGCSPSVVRQVTGFTEDLDEVSRALFSLKIGGSKEFCGQAINQALDALEWTSAPSAYRAIFIAGNESFDQGKVNYGEALPKALSKKVLINSIFCDNKAKGNTALLPQWESAAQLVGGLSFQINHNHHLPELNTPFDARIRKLNTEMNATFVWYGDGGEEAAANQKTQDENMAKMSDHAFAARMSAKIGHLYHHAHHDLIDALDHKMVDLNKMPAAIMPDNLRAMSNKQRMAFLNQKIAERQKIRRKMADIISQRHAFVQQKMSQMPNTKTAKVNVLGDALVRAVRSQAIARGFEFEENRTAQVTK
jgi:hypothetical protein